MAKIWQSAFPKYILFNTFLHFDAYFCWFIQLISTYSIDNKSLVVMLINRHNLKDGLIHTLKMKAKWTLLSTPFGGIPETLCFNIGVRVESRVIQKVFIHCIY